MHTPGHFAIEATEGAARAAVLHTARGAVVTPVFMPVGTGATVKAVAPDDLDAIGARIVLANTYHLYLRPGHELVRRLGGRGRYCIWMGCVMSVAIAGCSAQRRAIPIRIN